VKLDVDCGGHVAALRAASESGGVAAAVQTQKKETLVILNSNFELRNRGRWIV